MQAAATFVPNPIKWVVVVGADSAIKDITSDDLKVLTGKTVCISPNSAGSILFQRRVTEQGVAIVSKYYENARLAYDALVNKKCDASVLPNTLLKQQGLGVVRPVFTLRNYYQKQGSIEA
jgi:ABC-type amino acid transport substrate-binding protein